MDIAISSICKYLLADKHDDNAYNDNLYGCKETIPRGGKGAYYWSNENNNYDHVFKAQSKLTI